MSLAYNLKQFYFQSKIYVLFSIAQIMMTLALILYILNDYKGNFKKSSVLAFEFIIAIFMVIDVMLHGFTMGFKITFMFLLEWCTVISFIATFAYISYRGLSEVDEEIEFSLMVVRFVLQCIRLGLGIMRIKENNQKRSANVDLDMELSVSDKVNNNTRDNQHIVMVEL